MKDARPALGTVSMDPKRLQGKEVELKEKKGKRSAYQT